MERILCLVAIFATMCACSKDNQPEFAEVEISIDYQLPESGSMASRSGASLYADFHEKYIATRMVTPSTYTLTFTNTEDNSTVTIKDKWSDGHGLKLPTGVYRVDGASIPQSKDAGRYEKGLIDTIWLKFSEEIKITPQTTRLKLNAYYDSFMLIFDANDTSSISSSVSGDGSYNDTLKRVDDIYYMFLQSAKTGQSLTINRVNGSKATIDLSKMALEKGKYYYFGDIDSEYDLPEMDGGN